MTLLKIYRCFCDETRLRILHLLSREPLCVCHVQEVLRLPQVAVSKHLAYLRTNGLVQAERHGKWMIYRLPKRAPVKLDLQLRCLQDCISTDPIFREDLKRLSRMRCECNWLTPLRSSKPEKLSHGSR